MKKNELVDEWDFSYLTKTFRIMRITLFLMFAVILQTFANEAYSQKTKLSLDYINTRLEVVLDDIENLSEFYFLANEKLVNVDRRVNLSVKNKKIDEILDMLFAGTDVVYTITDRKIILAPSFLAEDAQQQRSVSGKVTDSGGQPLPGVTIVVKGTTQGTVTNADGNYSLFNISDDATLVFSFIGMSTQEIVVGSQLTINVIMEEEAIGIEEIVAIGYGTQRKVSTTSPVSQVIGEELARRPSTNIQQTLQGMAPGVTILDEGGYPGRDNAIIRVRGITTLGNNNPLILVDGVEQRLDDINPNDIESISILKDAASTAIYGSRAANGVVLVTTKRGNKGEEVNVIYSGLVAMRKSNNNPKHMPVEDYMRLQNIAYVNAGREARYTEEEIQTWVTTDDRITYPLPNTWFENGSLVRTGLQIDQNLSVSGGGEKIQGRGSIRWQKNDGVISSVKNKISEVRTNLDYSPFEILKLSTDINYRQNYSETALHNVFQFIFHAGQWCVPKYPDGSYGLSPQNQSPLVWNDLEGRDKLYKDVFIGNLKVELDIISGLKFIGQYSLNVNNNVQKVFRNAYKIYDYWEKTKVRKNVSKNSLDEIRDDIKETTLTSLLNYNYNKNRHQAKALAGYSEISNTRNYLDGYREFFYNNDVQSISMGSDDNKNITGYDREWGLKSFFGRANYIYDDRYIIEVNARWDGSSRFTGPNVYAFFPSVSGAWRISQEAFWNQESDLLRELKLRVSWGKSGNQAIPLYEFYPAMVSAPYAFNEQLAEGYLETSMANSELTWETTTQTNIGFDSQFFDQNLSFSFDWYKKTTDGILLELPIPGVVGLNPPQQNAGVVENKGIEIQVGYRGRHKNLSYDISGNMGYNANKIISLSGTGPYISTTVGYQAIYMKEEGHPIDTHYGYLIDGFFQSEEEVASYPTLYAGSKPGDTKYIDRNEDGKITPDDMTHIGNSFPSYTYGLTSTVTIRNFEFYWHWQGAADFMERIQGSSGEMGNQEGFCPDVYTNNYWTEDNRDARFPRPIKFDLRNVHASPLLIIDASYVRLKMLQIGYNIPASLLSRTFFKNMKLTLSGTDLITFSKLNEWGFDPEAHSVRGNYYPQTSAYSLGLVFQF